MYCFYQSLSYSSPKSDKHLISLYSAIPESNMKVMENKGNDHQQKKLLIVKQIPLFSSLANK